MPDHERLQWVLDVESGPVEQDIAQTPADHDTERYPDDDVVHVDGPHQIWRVPRQPTTVAPTEENSGEVSQGVPPDGKGTDHHQDWIDRGIGYRKGHKLTLLFCHTPPRVAGLISSRSDPHKPRKVAPSPLRSIIKVLSHMRGKFRYNPQQRAL